MRRFSWMLIAILAAGCGGDPPREIDWNSLRSSDGSCQGRADTVHKDFYDLNGDDRAETFIVQRCRVPIAALGDQLEIFVGGGDPATPHPTKLVPQIPPVKVDRLCFQNGSAIYHVVPPTGKVQVWQVRWREDGKSLGKPAAGPSHGCP